MLKIGKDEVHLWFATDIGVEDEALLSSYRELLNEEEARRYRRFIFDRHRHRFLIARALVRTVLSQYDQEARPEELAFSTNAYGKPRLARRRMRDGGLHFNLSHTEGLIVLAVAAGRDVGVDVEFLARRTDIMKLAWRYFSSREVEDLEELGEGALTKRFFDLWTLKESYIKACGMGLAIPLEDFSFRFSDDQITVSFSPQRNDIPERWRFWQFHPSPQHKMALAVNGEGLDDVRLIFRRGVPLREFEDFHCATVRDSGRGVALAGG